MLFVHAAHGAHTLDSFDYFGVVATDRLRVSGNALDRFILTLEKNVTRYHSRVIPFMIVVPQGASSVIVPFALRHSVCITPTVPVGTG